MSDHSGAGNVHTRRIAEFVSTLSYERIPAQVIERIKLLILDSLGCGITPSSRNVIPHEPADPCDTIAHQASD